MVKRTTVEIDEELLALAKRSLGQSTTRATIEEALLRASEGAEDEHQERVKRQREFFAELPTLADMAVLNSEEMWRKAAGFSTRARRPAAAIPSSADN